MYFGYYRDIRQMMGKEYIEILFMYLIGMFIRKWEIDSYFKKCRWLSFCVYILAGVFWSLQAMSIHVRFKPGYAMLCINGPFNILTAISFFCFIMSFDFKSNVINALAPGCFSAYLIQENSFLGEIVAYPKLKSLVQQIVKCPPDTIAAGATTSFVIVCASVLFVISVLLFDFIRRKVLDIVLKPIYIVADNLQRKLFGDPEHEKALP